MADKLTDSFSRLLKISKKIETNKSAENECQAESEDEEDVKIVIPNENKIEVAAHQEPLKSVVSPEYVKKVMRELDTMSTEMLRQALSAIKVSNSGTKRELRKRVAQYYRKENMLLNRKLENINSDKTLRYFDYLVAIDFECTCVEIIYDYPHEIIELPAVLIDVKEMKVISMFRTYVRPVRNPILSDFCIAFTKIAQETVDKAPYFREALQLLYDWMRRFGLGEKGVRFAFVTDGPHDMWKFMQFQCILAGMKMPHMFRSFINIKKIFKDRFHGLAKGNGKSGIENMLAKFDLKFQGNKHSGLDDAKNIASICLEMMKRKIELRINQKCVYKVNRNQHTEEEKDDDRQNVDISRRDFQMWMRKLPLKLQAVTRREFLNEEYLDCESCEELTDEKNENNSMERRMMARLDVERLMNAEFLDDFSMNIVAESSSESSGTDDETVEEEEMTEDDDSFDADSTIIPRAVDDVVELQSVWRRGVDEPGDDTTDVDICAAQRRQHPPNTIESASSSSSSLTMSTSTTSSSTVVSNSVRNIDAPPPRNSLASVNRHFQQQRFSK